MLPQEFVDLLKNTGQILLCLLLAAYMLFCAGLSAVLLFRSIWRGIQEVKIFFINSATRCAEKPVKQTLEKGKTYAMASRNLC